MIAAPWNLILTVVFVATGVICAIDLATRLRRPRHGHGSGGEVLVDINHILMSAAMIWMSWSMESELALWLQAALFAALTVALLTLLPKTSTAAQRLDLGGHLALNAAMIWMLAAMPLLMAEMAMAGTDMSGTDMGGMDMGAEAAAAATPAWADVVNAVFVALSVGAMLWWILRAVAVKGHRLHASCHAVMGAGMAAMLVLMN